MRAEVRRDREGRWVACSPLRADEGAPVHDLRTVRRIPISRGATRTEAEDAARRMGLIADGPQ